MADLNPKNFFNLDNFDYPKLFEVSEVWEVVKNLPLFIENMFKEGVFKENSGSLIYIDPLAKVDKSAKILGPAIILKGAKIGPNSYIRQNVIIGQNASVGFSCEVKNSVILNNARLAHLNYVGDSVIGNRVNFGAGAKTANLRFDGKPILHTGLEKFGVVVGDDSHIGVNAVCSPGTFLGKSCRVYPLTLASGEHPENSIIR